MKQEKLHIEVWHWSYMKKNIDGGFTYSEVTNKISTDGTLESRMNLSKNLIDSYFSDDKDSVVITSLSKLYSEND